MGTQRTATSPARAAQRWSAVLLGIAILPLTACFEEPVTERLRVEFTSTGAFTVSVTTVITTAGGADGNPALARRLADTRREYEQAADPWARRFALLEPSRERVTWERKEGALVRVVREAEGADLEALRRFMADTGLASELVVRAAEAEFIVIPGAGGRASRLERERVDRFLDGWTRDVARTLTATASLYAYLDHNPERALPCLASLFSDAVSADDRRQIADVNEREHALLLGVVQGRKAVLEVFEVPDDEAYSLNELSHRAFDPFPARFEVVIPGEPLEIEGFAIGNDGGLHVAGLGLFEALESLAGRWATPDPIVAYVRAMRARGERTLSPAELLASRPHAVAVAGDEIRAALMERLRPAPLYRVVFRLSEGETASE